MRNELSSTEFELKKCNKMKTSSVDLETLARIKLVFNLLQFLPCDVSLIFVLFLGTSL